MSTKLDAERPCDATYPILMDRGWRRGWMEDGGWRIDGRCKKDGWYVVDDGWWLEGLVI